jgi:hydroxyacylglutathione hydrolase
MCWGKNSDPVVLFDTLQKLKAGLHPETRIYPGHSYGFEPGKEFSFVRNHNLYLHFRDQESFVAYRMRDGQTRLFDFK